MAEKIPYIKKADDVAFYYDYLLATDNGIDYRKFPTDKRRIEILYNFAKSALGYGNDKLIRWCTNKYGYRNLTLRELQDEFKKRNLHENPRIFSKLVCCNSCHTGTSRTPLEEVERQREKYGEYICCSCEENSLTAGKTQDLKNSFGKNLWIAKNGLYYDEGARPKGSSWLGFAGRWFLLKTKGKAWLTNNLFIATGLHEKLLRNFEHNINIEIYGVHFLQDIKNRLTESEFEKIKETDGYKYFINGYDFEQMDRHWNKREAI